MEVLLLSHKGVASGFKKAAKMIVGDMSDYISVIELSDEEGVEIFSQTLEKFILDWLSNEKKAIVFADLIGGTPFNQAEKILRKHNLKQNAKVIGGMNLAMILEALHKKLECWTNEKLFEFVQLGKDSVNSIEFQVFCDSGDE